MHLSSLGGEALVKEKENGILDPGKMHPVFWQLSIWQDRLFQGAYHCHLRHNCQPSGLLLITKRKREINPACSLAEWSRSESWPWWASLPDTVWIFDTFFLIAHTWALHDWEESCSFPIKRCFFPSITSVFTVSVSPSVLGWDMCFDMQTWQTCLQSFHYLLVFQLLDEIKEVNWIRNLLTTANWKCATVSNAPWAFPSICSPSFTYVPITASNTESDLERPIRKWESQPIQANWKAS